MEIKISEKGVKYAIQDDLKGYRDSKIAKEESNDCFVRAVAAAFDIEYDLAHAWVEEKFKRKRRKGTFKATSTLVEIREAFGKSIKMIGEPVGDGSERCKLVTKYNNGGKVVERKMTTYTFLSRFTKGTFIIIKSQHAFAVRDGVIIGNASDALKLRSRIIAAFQIG